MAIAHVKTTQATVESDRATAAADAAQNDKAQSDFKRYEDLYKTKVVSPQDRRSIPCGGKICSGDVRRGRQEGAQ